MTKLVNYLTIILLLVVSHLVHAKSELTADESVPIPKVKIDAKGNLQITASPTSSASDFDFLVGKWKMHNRHLNKRLENCQEWTEFDSSDENSKILGGADDMDTYSTTEFPGQEQAFRRPYAAPVRSQDKLVEFVLDSEQHRDDRSAGGGFI